MVLGGQALAEIVFGKLDLSGKLSITITITITRRADLLQFIYNHKSSTYLRPYAEAPTKSLFEFGDGLSCMQFAYSRPTLLVSRIIENKSDYLSVIVSNSGVRARDEIVQLYMPVIFFTSNATCKRVERKVLSVFT